MCVLGRGKEEREREELVNNLKGVEGEIEVGESVSKRGQKWELGDEVRLEAEVLATTKHGLQDGHF